jgi:predicted nuclease of predicted toxin-antitoxin system
MRFKLDENLPVEILAELRSAGHEADSVYDESLDGEADSTILARVREEERILLTLDKGGRMGIAVTEISFGEAPMACARSRFSRLPSASPAGAQTP